jgi:UDP-3-O-[3-hydroxymyristoyl] N-acetylglucosamine deacetylase
VGLHSGFNVTLRLVPAPVNSGIRFRRPDLNDFEIEALRCHVAKVNYATTLMKQGVMISTVEHLMSAIYGLGIDNLYVYVDSLEIPILDGSSLPYVNAMLEVGLKEQDQPREYLQVLQPFSWSEQGKSVSVEPYDGFRITCTIDFSHPLIGVQTLDLSVNPETYRREVCFARTFGFLREVEMLLKNNLIRGASYGNAIVLSDEGVANGTLRQPDEFVRHKILDLIGDVGLLGRPLQGHLKASRSGHAAHATFVDKLLKRPDCYRMTTLRQRDPVWRTE